MTTEEDALLDTLLRLTGQPERPKPEPATQLPEYIWPDPHNPGGWVDAWNGAYDNLDEALRDAASGVGRPWVLRRGQGLITEAEMERQHARPQSPRAGTPVATPRQVAFLRTLIAERDGFEYLESGLASGLSKAEASTLIETVMKAPQRPRTPRHGQARRELAETGYYARDGEFFTVVNSRNTERRYAKRLVVGTNVKGDKVVRWEYAPGMVLSFTPDELLTLDQAKAFGHLHGYCIICCRPLHDPKSVEAGIGPDCAKNLIR